MIGRPLRVGAAIGLALLLGYEAAVRSGRVPAGEGLDDVAHGNVAAETVFVGSSLTHNVPFAGATLNLGVRGESSCLGAAILAKSPLRPKTVVVEMNTPLLRGENAAVLERLFNPVTYRATSAVWSLRETYRPFGVLSHAYQAKRRATDPKIPERIRKAAIEKQLTENGRALNEAERERLARNLELLEERLSVLASRGAAVRLIWIPGEAEVEATARVREFRRLVEESQVGKTYPWLPTPAARWRTNDGVHLIPSQAAELARALVP